jgi:uncharacterized protein YegL
MCVAQMVIPKETVLLVFLMTDGTPSDALAHGEAVKAIRGRGFGSIIACAVGPKVQAST